MPWKAVSEMEEKVRFVSAYLSGEAPLSVLCERHGISRQTGHVLVKRFRQEGAGGLEPRSRAPHHHGRAMAAEVAVRLIEARRAKPYWGPRKQLARLREAVPDLVWPSPSAVADLYRREGLSRPRRVRRRGLSVEQPFALVEAANDAWCIDFKGWFRTGDGVRCDPLTVSDAWSRYLLAVRILDPVTAAVEREMDRLFREHGLPRAIRSDNGPPFASSGAGGLTKLSVRWAKMNIALERIEPGKPQQNGRHERMHGTLKGEACAPPAATRRRQQRRFDEFRAEYNEERPHEALGQIPPARLYVPSPRPFPRKLEDPVYDADEEVRRVRLSGEIKWRGSMIFVSEALIGEAVALKQRSDGHWAVRFASVPLLLIDRKTGKASRFGPGRPARPKAPNINPSGLSGMYPD